MGYATGYTVVKVFRHLTTTEINQLVGIKCPNLFMDLVT